MTKLRFTGLFYALCAFCIFIYKLYCFYNHFYFIFLFAIGNLHKNLILVHFLCSFLPFKVAATGLLIPKK